MNPDSHRFARLIEAWGVVLRGVRAGVLAGMLVGGVTGAVLGLVMGAVIGVVYGGVVGIVLGLPCGILLAVLRPILTTYERAALAAAALAALCSVPVVSVLLPGLGWRGHTFAALLCGLVGAVVGPGTVFERYPDDVRRAAVGPAPDFAPRHAGGHAGRPPETW